MNKKVLLVTETDLVKFRFDNLIENLEMSLITASNKIDCIHKLNYHNNNFDLFILDLDLGEEIFELINEFNLRRLRKPIVVLSSKNNKKVFIRVIKSGIDDFIIKPFDDERIMNTLNKYLEFEEISLRYLSGNYEEKVRLEIKKANKGKYPLTFIFFRFVGNNKKYLANNYMKEIRKKLWDTDEVLFLNEYALLGIYPFSGDSDRKILEEKLKFFYSEVTEGKKIYDNSSLMIKSQVYRKDIYEYEDIIENFEKYLG